LRRFRIKKGIAPKEVAWGIGLSEND